MTDSLLFLFAAITYLFSSLQLFVALRVALLIQTFGSGGKFNKHEPVKLPKAAVVLSLRGSNGTLPRLLDSLVHQEYPDYTVHIVVDDTHSKEWALVEEMRARFPKIIFSMPLVSPLASCSLKNSALVQAVQSANPDREVFVFVDADADIYPGWIRELVAPLNDGSVAASTGYRWYMPSSGRFGSLVRYYWNVGSIGVMWALDIAWGGSMAIKRADFERAGLAEIWRNSLVDDTTVAPALAKHGLKLRISPSVFVINREEIGVLSFLQWAKRQTVFSRLYSPLWPLIILHTLLSGGWRIPAAIISIWMIAEEHEMLFFFLIAEGYYWATAVLSVFILEHRVRRVAQSHNDDRYRWISWTTAVKLPFAMISAHILALYILIGALLVRVVSWRGVDYTILPGSRVRMVEYKPFVERTGSKDETIM